MCWQIKRCKFDKNPDKYHKIAEKDIIVYKFGNVSKEDNCFHPYFKKCFSYKSNVLNEEIKFTFAAENYYYEYYIDEGYHSYSDDSKQASYPLVSEIGKFIIPQGTEYYVNSEGEIVSSQIMWTGEYEQNIPLNMEDIIKNINKKILK